MKNKIKDFISNNKEKWIEWRHHLHQNPETAFEEFETSKFVAQKLESFGLEVHTGLATTGVVGVLKNGTSNKSIALRADMDALDIEEQNDFSYISKIKGKMHACGHDGHTTMLLAAAEYLSQNKDFDGTVYFIFQPAEENVAGGKVMIDEGLFKQFPADMVFGMHNWPGIKLGTFATKSGAVMASNDMFEINVRGKSTHAAIPEGGLDPIVVGADIVSQLNKITSRNVSPKEASVVTVTQINSGSAWNIIPDNCQIRGTVRAFSNSVRDLLQQRIEQTANGVAESYGTTADVKYNRAYCPTVNTLDETNIAISVATDTFGKENVDPNPESTTAAEDFGYMLQEVNGNFMWLGNGDSQALHNSKYDFDDKIIPNGVEYWISLTNHILSN